MRLRGYKQLTKCTTWYCSHYSRWFISKPPQTPPQSFLTDNGPHVVQIYLLRMQHWTPSVNNSKLVDTRTVLFTACSIEQADTGRQLLKNKRQTDSCKSAPKLQQSTGELKQSTNSHQTNGSDIYCVLSCIPPLLVITETPNLLGRLFIFRFCFFFLHAKQRVDMTGLARPVSAAGHYEKRESSNRAIE